MRNVSRKHKTNGHAVCHLCKRHLSVSTTITHLKWPNTLPQETSHLRLKPFNASSPSLWSSFYSKSENVLSVQIEHRCRTHGRDGSAPAAFSPGLQGRSAHRHLRRLTWQPYRVWNSCPSEAPVLHERRLHLARSPLLKPAVIINNVSYFFYFRKKIFITRNIMGLKLCVIFLIRALSCLP